MSNQPLPLIDHTPDGPQYMLDGFTPVGVRERLEHLADQPMQAACSQRPADFGLFDQNQFNQRELFE